jgi:hypothetical protein
MDCWDSRLYSQQPCNDPTVNYFNKLHNNVSILISSKNFHLDYKGCLFILIHSRSQKFVTYSKLSKGKGIKR